MNLINQFDFDQNFFFNRINLKQVMKYSIFERIVFHLLMFYKTITVSLYLNEL